MAERLRFPDGREIDIHDVISFVYGLGESEIRVLHLLMNGKKLTTDELAKELKVTKASINKAVNTLVEKGLVDREKLLDKKKGRPIYLYYVRKDYFLKKLSEDTTQVLTSTVETIKKLMSERA